MPLSLSTFGFRRSDTALNGRERLSYDHTCHAFSLDDSILTLCFVYKATPVVVCLDKTILIICIIFS